MIYLTPEQSQAIDLLDKMIATADADDIKKFVEEKEIIMKLKGTSVNDGVFTSVLTHFNNMASEIHSLRAENSAIKADFQKLIMALNKTIYGYSSDFDDLKRKHNVY
jgi:hypothetical protein